jgi:hypothetical protein
VWVVCILVGLIFVSAWGSVVIPWRWWMSPVGFLNLAVAHALLGLMFYSYYLTVTTCPGRVPPGWVPSLYFFLGFFKLTRPPQFEIK